MRISFHGASDEVTGSCHLLETVDTYGNAVRILFDCGMFQGEQMCGSKNNQPFAFDPTTINLVCVSHPHADHTGRLSRLTKEGYTGKIYMVEPCVGLAKLVLEDAFHIMQDDAKRCGSSVLYELEDVERVFKQVESVSYHQHIEVAPGVVVMFHEAGHVLGSSYISVDCEGKRVVYSGDIGNDLNPILPKTEPISHADIVICESTYGHRHHEGVSERSDKLVEAMKKVIDRRGVLMIPAFSIERTQELLYEMDQILLHKLKTSIPIFLDSPMAIKATALYRHYKNFLQFNQAIMSGPDQDFFSFPNLHETLTVDASKHINDATPPYVVIAGSGMMSGGRIMHHLRRHLSDEHSHLLIIGYQAKGTLGHRLYNGAKEVKIFGESIDVHATISAIGAFSAHGDQEKLTRWLKPEDGKMPSKVFLVHGDDEAKTDFATHLRTELQTEIVIPEYQQTYEC